MNNYENFLFVFNFFLLYKKFFLNDVVIYEKNVNHKHNTYINFWFYVYSNRKEYSEDNNTSHLYFFML